jgi:Uma2 family endonuclease
MGSALPLLAPDLADLERVEDFVAWMAAQPMRHEMIDGRLTTRPGGTRLHSRLTLRLGSSLERQLAGQSCEAYNGDFLLDLGPRQRFYPDAMMVRGETRDWTDRPALVIEVLSETTMAYDLGPKLQAYRALPSVLHVVCFWQDRPLARVWAKGAEPVDVAGPDVVVELPGLGLRLPLAELYAGLLPEQAPAAGHEEPTASG